VKHRITPFLAAVLLTLLHPSAASAQCANPAGVEGQMMYNGTAHAMQYCNNLNVWHSMGTTAAGAGGGGCSSPAGVEGQTMYNGTYHVMQYCDGTNWQAMMSPATTATTTPTSGLVGWWQFLEGSGTTTADSSGHGNTGTLVSSPTWVTTAYNGGGLTFNGTTQYVNAGAGASLSSTTFTYSFWMNAVHASDNAVVEQTINKSIDNPSNNYNYQFNWRHVNGGVYPKSCVFRDSTPTDHVVQIAGTMNPGTWYMVTCTYDGTSLKVYLNGALDSTTTTSATPITGSSNLFIGSGSTNGDVAASWFDGTLDDVRVYNIALSASQILALYKATAPTPLPCTPIDSIVPQGLVGWWTFDAGSGTTAADSSGLGNTGTLNGSPAWTTAGEINGALTFNQGTCCKYVDAGDAASLQITGSMTTTAWVNFSSINPSDADDNFISKESTTGSLESFAFKGSQDCTGNANDQIVLEVTDGGANGVERCGNTIINTGKWYFVAAVYNAAGPSIDIYVNGVLDSGSYHYWGTMVSVPTSLYNSTGTFKIGVAQMGSNSNAFNGTVDDARVYNRALSAQEILDIYNQSPEGTLVYNATSHIPQFCNGRGWQATQ
jgi:hypothetical protein